ncbi:WXG100 family type VII secretion target [Streptomyces sp. NPDC021093]|uniref:WXG100 family type VII secretion target n=1 Tax=Streptomyces sp. NPDC021093 TaxID=3365112 RepID=UPI0037AFEF7E
MPAPQDGSMVVTYASLDLAAENVRRQSGKLEAQLKEIQAMVASHSTLWEGEAQTAYKARQDDWNNQAAAIHDALKKISHQISEAVGKYKSADAKAAGNF